MKKYLQVILVVLSFSLSKAQPSITVISQTNSPCFNVCAGAVTFSISGATGPFTVTGGCTSTSSTAFTGNTVTISGLCPSCPVYNYVFMNGPFSIVGTKTVNISSPPPIFAVMSKTNVCCNGMCNGAISATVTGGTAPYTYSWSPFGSGTGSFINNLCAGNYTLDVMDSNGCTGTFTNTITQPAPLMVSLSQSATTCSACCDGTISAMATGGNAPYTYSIFPGGTTNSNGNFPNVCNGTYSICVSDNGCCMTCNGITVTTSTATAVSHLNKSELNVSAYPNPNNGHFFLKGLGQNLQYEYELYDVVGKLISKGNAATEISVSVPSAGIYELRLVRDKEIVYRQKLEIQK